MKKILIVLIVIFIAGCSNIHTSHGDEAEDIAGFINLKDYKPKRVEYELTKIGDDRLGPADYTLQAVAYFDPGTFEKLKSDCQSDENLNQFFNSNTFMFEWLPQEIKEELVTNKQNVKSYTNTKISANPNCEVCFLDNKILIYYFTN
ncbi:hypothetical protein OGH69_09555 [Flavobacterium sp. MFBS3-15]|uniref:hypothetical protein n=1 Tax=Flavobacterium sp. MFBS3-15 TaxID=2989816 RepID=UPI00223620C8|nr:hypothetical protein [Flavobacterium sp. MFBS3-15]MCW4469210.1 hypothetical protein [Flavobacterium sp. MFBS3-15]